MVPGEAAGEDGLSQQTSYGLAGHAWPFELSKRLGEVRIKAAPIDHLKLEKSCRDQLPAR